MIVARLIRRPDFCTLQYQLVLSSRMGVSGTFTAGSCDYCDVGRIFSVRACEAFNLSFSWAEWLEITWDKPVLAYAV